MNQFQSLMQRLLELVVVGLRSVLRNNVVQKQDCFVNKKSFHTGTTIAGAVFKVSRVISLLTFEML